MTVNGTEDVGLVWDAIDWRAARGQRRAAAAQDLHVNQASLPLPGRREQVSREALPKENNHGSAEY